jgi:membrane protease YdiL (CAAX protease family)
MSYPGGQTDTAGRCSLAEPVHRLLTRPVGAQAPRLGAETVAVAFCTIAAIALVNARGAQAAHWLATPALLVAAALVPTWVRRREFPRFGLDPDHIRSALRTVGCVGACIFPAVFLGLWLLTRLHVPLPLRPALGEQQDRLAWLLYQFLYVAAAEEVFFRGYIQANTARLLRRAGRLSRPTQQYVAIFTSAACFALAHVVVQGRITSLLVFLPGLVMAWLFARTRTLLAPVLFHGLANVSYGLMALALT